MSEAVHVRCCRLLRSPRALLLIVAIVMLGCEANEPAVESAGGSASVSAESVVTAVPPPWYHRARTLDLTGDGGADSVRLDAFGVPGDSLRIVLSIIVDGQEKHREEWGSSYELALMDSAARVRPGVDTVLRAQLDSVLASVVVQPLGAPGVVVMAEDSAILGGLEPRPTHRVSFFYGYETAVRLVWDAPRARFVRLWSCC